MAYYIIGANDKKKTANVLSIGENNESVFNDIANVDLNTLQFQRGDIRYEFANRNSEFDISTDSTFIVQYPYRKDEGKLYYMIPRGNATYCKSNFNLLEKKAKERTKLIELGENTHLERDSYFYDVVSCIIDDIIYDYYTDGPEINALLSKDSLIIKYIKDKFMDLRGSSNMSDRKIKETIVEALREYKALRYFVLEYNLYVERRNTLLRNNLKRFAEYSDKNSIIADKYVVEAITGHQTDVYEYMKSLNK